MIKKQFTSFLIATDISKLITNNQIVLFKPQFKTVVEFSRIYIPGYVSADVEQK